MLRFCGRRRRVQVVRKVGCAGVGGSGGGDDVADGDGEKYDRMCRGIMSGVCEADCLWLSGSVGAFLV